MFLKRNRRKAGGETYEYWSPVRTVRTARGPRHELVANPGKAPGLDGGNRRGWEAAMDLLDGRDPGGRGRHMKLGEQVGEVSPSPDKTAHRAEVDIRGLRVERVRWELIACILAIARFCGNKGELGVVERWYADSALEDLPGGTLAADQRQPSLPGSGCVACSQR